MRTCLGKNMFLFITVSPGVPYLILLHNVTLCNRSLVSAKSNAIKDVVGTLPNTNWF